MKRNVAAYAAAVMLVTLATPARASSRDTPQLRIRNHCEKPSSVEVLQIGRECFWQYDWTLIWLPDELRGLETIKARDPYRPLRFWLSVPARGYWVIEQRDYTPMQPGWTLYRTGAVAINRATKRYDVYYRDFDAGRHEVSNWPNRLLCIGFKTFEAMTPADCVLNVHATTKDLVYRSGDELTVRIVVDNPTTASISAVVTWRIGGTARHGEVKLQVPARTSVSHLVELGNLPEGLHQMLAELFIGGVRIDRRIYPIGRFDVPPPDAVVSEPFFPFGVYNKYDLTRDPEIARIYLHAICWTLRRYNMNTLVGPGLQDLPAELRIMRRYGIRDVVRFSLRVPQAVYDDPSVLALMYGDEPSGPQVPKYRQAYEQFHKQHPQKPLVTCLIGEQIETVGPGNPLNIWRQLRPRVRLVRYYPMRMRSFGPLCPGPRAAPWYAFAAFERAGRTAWWYVLQAFGRPVTKNDPQPYWRVPTPAEINAVTHMALAHSARGIIAYSLQRLNDWPWSCMVDQQLQPTDERLAAMGKLGALIARHKELLMSLGRADRLVYSDDPAIYAVRKFARDDAAKTGTMYLYVINRDTLRRHEARVTPALGAANEPIAAETAVEVFSGRTSALVVEGDDPRFKSLLVSLEPGQAQLWRIERAGR